MGIISVIGYIIILTFDKLVSHFCGRKCVHLQCLRDHGYLMKRDHYPREGVRVYSAAFEERIPVKENLDLLILTFISLLAQSRNMVDFPYIDNHHWRSFRYWTYRGYINGENHFGGHGYLNMRE